MNFCAAAMLIVALAPSGEPAAETATYIEQTVRTTGLMGQPPKVTTQRLWIGDDRLCMHDWGNEIVTVIDRSEESLLIISRNERAYTELTREQLAQLAKDGMAVLKHLGFAGEPTVTVAKTGNTGAVGQWDAYEVTANIRGPMNITMTLWLSAEVPVGSAVWMKLSEVQQMQAMLGDAIPKLAAYEGYPVKQQSHIEMMGMEVTSTTEVTTVRAESIDESVCTVPEEFTLREGLLPVTGMGMPRNP